MRAAPKFKIRLQLLMILETVTIHTKFLDGYHPSRL